MTESMEIIATLIRERDHARSLSEALAAKLAVVTAENTRLANALPWMLRPGHTVDGEPRGPVIFRCIREKCRNERIGGRAFCAEHAARQDYGRAQGDGDAD